jgi:FdrA protein
VIERVLEEARAAGRTLDVAALVIGTDLDPQGLERQIETLRRAGAQVFEKVTEMVEYACGRVGREIGDWEVEIGKNPVPLVAFQAPLAAVTVGLESFYDSLLAQGASAVHVDWRPPAGGNEKLAGILAKLKTPPPPISKP